MPVWVVDKEWLLSLREKHDLTELEQNSILTEESNKFEIRIYKFETN